MLKFKEVVEFVITSHVSYIQIVTKWICIFHRYDGFYPDIVDIK